MRMKRGVARVQSALQCGPVRNLAQVDPLLVTAGLAAVIMAVGDFLRLFPNNEFKGRTGIPAKK